MLKLAIVLAAMLLAGSVYAIPVFPGCEGYGCETKGGRGGQVIKVTNLNDAGTGSLRAALEASGPRIIVFETSGTIELKSTLFVRNPYFTIAGQTAPSPGITIKNYGLLIRTHDGLVQHIRIRPGDAQAQNLTPEEYGNIDGVSVWTGEAYNLVFDHVSLSWAIDENMGIAPGDKNRQERNVTLSNSILSEALFDSFHRRGPHSKGFLADRYSQNVSLIGNLFAHNDDRNPWFKDATSVVIVNNVIYNWRYAGYATYIGGSGEDPNIHYGPTLASIINNVHLRGPNTADLPKGLAVLAVKNLVQGSQIYISGEITDATLFRNHASFDPVVNSPPISISNFAPIPSTQVHDHVLTNAGARPADRDAVDKRVVQEVKDRKGKIIDSQSEVGGWPTLAVNQRTFTIPANPNADDDNDGYTNIEEVLHQMAAEVEGKIVKPKDLPVFPGCQGFGCETVGGRGGQIIKVTNLNDSCPGSLRVALGASGPRIVVFETS